MTLRRRTIRHRVRGALAALLGLAVLLVAASGLAVVPETAADERLYLQAAPCPSGSSPEPTDDCLHARPARVACIVIRDEPKYEEFTLRLLKAPGLPDEIDTGSAGPLLDHLTPGEEVTVTLWRDYAVSVARGGTVQNTADTPEGEAVFVTAGALALSRPEPSSSIPEVPRSSVPASGPGTAPPPFSWSARSGLSVPPCAHCRPWSSATCPGGGPSPRSSPGVPWSRSSAGTSAGSSAVCTAGTHAPSRQGVRCDERRRARLQEEQVGH